MRLPSVTADQSIEATSQSYTIISNQLSVKNSSTIEMAASPHNDAGLRRRSPAPPPPEREPEIDYQGPSLQDKIAAYLADAQTRPEYYAEQGFLGTFTFILGQLGFNTAQAFIQGVLTAPSLVEDFKRTVTYYENGETQNATAQAAELAGKVASLIETGLGTKGMLSYVTTGVTQGASAAKTKTKKD